MPDINHFVVKEDEVRSNGLPFKGKIDTQPPQDEVDICLQFLRQCAPTKIPRANSYWLKHVIEKWAGHYVCNGAAILAAVRLGVPVLPYPHSPNAALGISLRSIRKVMATRFGEQFCRDAMDYEKVER